MKILLLLLVSLTSSAQINPADSLLRADTSYVLLQHPTYSTVYSHSRNGPLFSMWTLTSSDIGVEHRFVGPFYPDTLLPKHWYHVTQSDYNATGYDRWHLLCSKDRTDTHTDNVSTFATSNITPQDPKLNRVTWLAVEEQCRKLAESGDTLAIYAGVYGRKGVLKHNIAIPSYCWKVILSRRDSWAILMPNEPTVSEYDWKHYIVPVADIEAMTGLKFPKP